MLLTNYNSHAIVKYESPSFEHPPKHALPQVQLHPSLPHSRFFPFLQSQHSKRLPHSSQKHRGIPPLRTKMKPQPSILLSQNACRHIYDSGRRCRFPVLQNANFCVRHIQSQLKANFDADLTRHFGPNPLNFRSACEVNDFLCSLAKLLVEDRIPVRRASVLAYVASLELRTLPEIDQELGHTRVDDDVPLIIFDRPQPLESSDPPAPAIHETPVTTGPSPS